MSRRIPIVLTVVVNGYCLVGKCVDLLYKQTFPLSSKRQATLELEFSLMYSY